MSSRGILVIALLNFAVIASGAFGAEPDRKMAACAVIQDGIKRLECFDALTKKRGVPGPEVKRSKAGKWTVSEDTSKIDDSRNVYLNVKATEPIKGKYSFKRTTPTLWVRCTENRTSLIINFERFLGSEGTDVTTRIDREPAEEINMGISTNYEAIGLWHASYAIPFIKRLFGKQHLLVRLTPYGDNPVTAEFEISGLKNAIKPLREACKWPEVKKEPRPVVSSSPAVKTKLAKPKDKKSDVEFLGPLPD